MNDVIDEVAAVEQLDQADSEKIAASELHLLTEEFLNQYQVITFDCFDTLLWRNVERPIDVFYTMTKKPMFQQCNFTADLRIKYEEIARRRQFVEKGQREVSYRDIYLTFNPLLSDQAIEALYAEELEAEIEHCYAFKPMVDILNKALALNKKVLIVSDTYLSQAGLKKLLIAHIDKNSINQLNDVIVSCEYGVSKSQGLHQLTRHRFPKEKILHIGDHDIADVKAAVYENIDAIHFKQYHDVLKQYQKLRHNALSLFDARVRESEPAYALFKDVHAKMNHADLTAEAILGYYALGPLMAAFAMGLKKQLTALRAQGVEPIVLFLLRDGYLPHQVFNTLYPEEAAKKVRISRFSSYAASFAERADIVNYLADVIYGKRFEDMAKQLLFTDDEIQALNRLLSKEKEKDQVEWFRKHLLTHKNVDLIIKRSQKYRERLFKYLQYEANIQNNDTLLLVDLGYSGTTQTKLTPVFEKAYQLKMAGYYLLSLSVPGWKQHRKGLIDPSCCDEKSLQTMVTYVALLEQLCTTTDESVIDFNENGQPIFGKATIHPEQHQALTQIQAGAITFASHLIDNIDYFNNLPQTAIQQMAIGELARLLFLPTQFEMNLLQHFKFDLNLGTTETFNVFDASKGLTGLKQRGLFFMEKNLKNMRMNYPAELRYAGIELALTLITQQRHHIEMSLTDMSFRRYALKLVAMKDDKNSVNLVEAVPTYDGYYSLIIPANHGEYMFAIMANEPEMVLQIESLDVIPVTRLYSDTESLYTQSILNKLHCEKVNKQPKHIFTFEADAALMIMPLDVPCEEKCVYRLVFRPL